MEVIGEDDLASEPGVLVENPSPRVFLEHVLLVVCARRELVEPLLSDVDLALGGAGFDVLEPVGVRVDQAVVGQSLQEGAAGEAHYFALPAVDVDREELHDAVGDFPGG